MKLLGTLVLASQSPRRCEILRGLGLTFVVRPQGIDETPRSGEAFDSYARRMAFEKAHAADPPDGSGAILAADTVVVCKGELMGKPADAAEGLRMLRKLSGCWHTVTTAVCVRGPEGRTLRCEVETSVAFRALPEEALRRYVATGEGEDKAGSYGIQALGAGMVNEVRGSYTNVVGLPAAESLQLLESVGVLEAWP